MKENYWEVLKVLLTAAGLIFAGWQVMLSRKDFEKRNQRLQIEKAIEMAGFYRSQIMPYLDIITVIFRDAHLDIHNKGKIGDFRDFNSKELMANFTTDDVIRFWKLIGEPAKYYPHKLEKDANLNDRFLSYKDYRKLNFAPNDTIGCISELLNSLEEFSMYFVTGVADEETVYQSLHQSFRSAIKLLYIVIATKNDDEKNKYYTNTIELFTIWDERYKEKEFIEAENNIEQQEMQKQAKEKQKPIIHKGKKL